jgi:transcription elongation GreA/GreB family factor
MPVVDKRQVLALLQQRLAAILDRLTEAQKSAQAGATHPDNKQEHAKDMRSTESSYLARGLAERVETLRDGLRALALLRAPDLGDDEAACPGALVTVEDEDGRESLYLLAPAGGGERFEVGRREVLVLTPQSPLGAALAGRRAGETFEVNLPAGRMRAEIVEVA